MSTQSKNDPNQSAHKWKFFRSGGFDQVRLETLDDLLHLEELDQKLWAVLSCPVKDIEMDLRFLTLIDSDGDGRIRVPEVLSAAKWTCSMLKNHETLFRNTSALSLAAIDDASDGGKRLLASARHILSNLGKKEDTEISPDETADMTRIFSNTRFNGDGIVPPECSDDERIVQAIRDIISCVGSVPDRSGREGINTDLLEKFFQEAGAYSEWQRLKADSMKSLQDRGLAVDAAYDAYQAVAEKIDDYFLRSQLASYDSNARSALSLTTAGYEQLNAKSVILKNDDLRVLPLAAIEPDQPLHLSGRINPSWASSIDAFRFLVVAHIIGNTDSLDIHGWNRIKNEFVTYANWRAGKKGGLAEKLGFDRVRELIAGEFKAGIEALIAEDKTHEPEATAIAEVDKLVLFHRDLVTLLNNFVNLKDFYGVQKTANFQIGELFLDQRCCELCVKVDDVGKHSAVATLSGTFLVYCECTRKHGSEKTNIAAAITNGDSDNLAVGRHGIFYDRSGNDWDAIIVKMLEHPISIRQAFWSPYKRVAKMIGSQIEKFAAASDKAAIDKTAQGLTTAAASATAAPAAAPDKPPPPTAFDIAKFAGIFAAIGLAIGAIGTAIASVVTGFMGLHLWQMPLAIAGLILAVSGPSMLLAFLALRKRNLAPILDANGWAVNTRAKMNLIFGTALTSLAVLPRGSERTLRDPYAEKKKPWIPIIFVLLLIAVIALWLTGKLETWIQMLI
jgi:hypothetical protein